MYSILAIARLWTSSGPSAILRILPQAKNMAKGKSSDKPAPPND